MSDETALVVLAVYAPVVSMVAFVLLLLWIDERHWRKYHQESEDRYFQKYLTETRRIREIEAKINRAFKR